MKDKIEGFILNSIDYKDNDLLLQVLTKNYGLLSLVAKGAKKINTKNHFMPMCLYEFIFDYKENKTIFSLHNGKLLHNYYYNDDIESMAYKNIFMEVCLKSRELIYGKYYEELITMFNKINDDKYLAGCLFFSFLFKEYGISPHVDGCLICDNKEVIALSIKNGGFLCHNHSTKAEIMDVERLKKFRYACKASFDNYDVLKEFNYDHKDFSLFVDFFITNSEVRLKSYDFYQKEI